MSVFFKRALLAELGPFDIFSTTEYSVWLSIASKYELSVVKEYLASFRIHRGTMTTSIAISLPRGHWLRQGNIVGTTRSLSSSTIATT